MPASHLIFYALGAGAVIASALMLLPTTGRNPIHGALLLIGSLFCLAGIYALLSAHLLTALQIIVYAGAVMVLFTFVIMLLNLSPSETKEARLSPVKVLGAILGLFVFGKLMTAIGLAAGSVPAVDLADPTHAGFGTVRAVGKMIYSTYLVPFELASVLLLVAAVGAVVLAKKNLTYVDRPAPPPARLTRLAHPADAGDGHGDADPGHH